MPPSYKKIDYSLRPAKHTERRMLCDILRKLSNFHKLVDYTYVGFGAIAFNDFIMFHKALGIKDMISFEEDNGDRAVLRRLEDNKPFNSIRVVNKKSTLALPDLSWEKPHIVWLDYDDPLLPSMFLDIGTIANHARSGTALAISFSCQKAPEACKPENGEGNDPVANFIANFGKDRVPQGIDEMNLTGWDYGQLGARMLEQELKAVLASRNARLPDDEKLDFIKICSFEYEDGTKMHTLVGIFVQNKDKDICKRCDFSGLDFLEKSSVPRIIIPKLTLKEIKTLEKQLPLQPGERIKYGHIPQSDASRFIQFYRYLPNFSVLEN